jgi:DNA processing protein
MLNKQEKLLVSLSKLKGVGNSILRAVLPDIHNGFSLQEIASKHSKIRKGIDSTPNHIELLELDIEACDRNGVEIISVFNDDFPEGLIDSNNSALFLYLKGNRDLLSRKSLAIIGTRTPDSLASEYAVRIARYFTNAGVPILSGLALGCDSLAHAASLDAGGEAIAVMAHGLHTIAPSQNRGLAERIQSSGGLLVSEYAMGTPPSKFTYVQRDNTQSALSSAIVLIQSALDGGSLHACRASLKVGKKVFFLPPTDPQKIDINSEVHSGSEGACSILNCGLADMNNVVPLSSKDDYPQVLRALKSKDFLK